MEVEHGANSTTGGEIFDCQIDFFEGASTRYQSLQVQAAGLVETQQARHLA